MPPILAELQQERDALTAELKACGEALILSNLALRDAMTSYASDQSGLEDISEMQQRVSREGGTLAYLAKTRKRNLDALARPHVRRLMGTP